MCLYPRLIINRKYTSNKKNGGNVPPIHDDRIKYVPVGCTYCIECRKKKSREWQVRLMEDIKTNKNAKFITLTLSDKKYAEITKNIQSEGIKIEHPYDMDNAIATYAVKHFRERYRKEHGKSLRHWLITELGHKGTENIHIHGLIWIDDIEQIEKHWQYGIVWTGKTKKLINGKITNTYNNYVNEKTVNYIIKYVTKIDEKHPKYTSKILTSPGIGNNYTNTLNAKQNKYNAEKTKETYKTRTGTELNLPIYYRNKIYTEKEREQLWLQKLDKEERWIMGQKISVKNGDDKIYTEALKEAREKNKRLKFGSNEINQEQEQYQRDRRILMQKTRIAKANKKGASPAGS